MSEEFETFGYPSDKKCRICDSCDTRVEPRFHYTVCIDHFNFSPVELQTIAEREK